MIEVFPVQDIEEGSYQAVSILQQQVDKNTLFLLSGGSSPKQLYELLANKTDFIPGAVSLIDERYGKPFHDDSNEKMIKETGLFDYFKEQKVKVYRVLNSGDDRIGLTLSYNRIIESLFRRFAKKVAVMGIGIDGHTAGIAPNRQDFKNPLFGGKYQEQLVGDFNDENGPFGQRITLTFKALVQIDVFVVLVFGENKKKVVQSLIKGPIGDIKTNPSMFYRTAKGHTCLITDQLSYDIMFSWTARLNDGKVWQHFSDA